MFLRRGTAASKAWEIFAWEISLRGRWEARWVSGHVCAIVGAHLEEDTFEGRTLCFGGGTCSDVDGAAWLTKFGMGIKKDGTLRRS